MSPSTKQRFLMLCAVSLVTSLCGCSQFRAPEVEVGSQSLSDPFDKAVEAARTGDLDYLKTCVASDQRYVDAYDASGRTLLHHAAQLGDTRIVAYLLEQGAYVAAEDEEGYTPLDLAIQSVAPKDAIDLLREAMLKEAGGS